MPDLVAHFINHIGFLLNFSTCNVASILISSGKCPIIFSKFLSISKIKREGTFEYPFTPKPSLSVRYKFFLALVIPTKQSLRSSSKGEKTFCQSHKKNMVKFKSFGGMYRHDLNTVTFIFPVAVTQKCDILQKSR